MRNKDGVELQVSKSAVEGRETIGGHEIIISEEGGWGQMEQQALTSLRSSG